VGNRWADPGTHTTAQQKEASRRRAQGATLQELADSYDRSISTMRRATRAA
jgi:DNA-binding CsgD family transcriptional regulator